MRYLTIFVALSAVALDARGQEFPGVVRPARFARVASEVAGRITERLVEEHAIVETGALLFRLDDTIARAAVQAAEADLIEAEAVHAFAKAELARADRLVVTDAGSRAQRERTLAEERRAWAAVLRARAALERARYSLDRTKIRAPFSGQVMSIDGEVGEFVNPGSPLISVMDLDWVEIESWLDVEAITRMKQGSPVVVGAPNRMIEGRIHSVALGSNELSRGFKVIIRTEQPRTPGHRGLQPGEVVRWRLAK